MSFVLGTSPMALGLNSSGWDDATWGGRLPAPAVVAVFEGSVQPRESVTVCEMINLLVISSSFAVGLRTCGRMMQFWHKL